MPNSLQYDPSPLKVELVPATCWWSNVRSNVTRSEWEKCKSYARAKTDGVCIICGQSGFDQGRRYPTEAHEIWEYDDEEQVQTLVDIVPLCPLCHQVKHMGRTRETSSLPHYIQVLNHLKRVNQWPDWKIEQYLELIFEIHRVRSSMRWALDISFLEREVGLTLTRTHYPVTERSS